MAGDWRNGVLSYLSFQLRGAFQKKISQIVEKVHKGVKSKIKKVYISNVDYFD